MHHFAARLQSRQSRQSQALVQQTCIIGIALLTTLLGTGCGQSGALYPAEAAPSNTKFLLYKANQQTGAPAESAIKLDTKSETSEAATIDAVSDSDTTPDAVSGTISDTTSVVGDSNSY